MKKLFTILSIIGSMLVSPLANSKDPEILEFSKKNTVVLREAVTQSSVTALQKEISDISNELSDDDTIYLVLDTPGGSISAGESLITYLKALPQKVVTVTMFAASMGFIIAQYLDDRLILPTGTMMTHRAHLSLKGQVPGEFETRYNYYRRMINRIETYIAKRMKTDIKTYARLRTNEYWASGETAIKSRMADKIVLAKCGEDLSGTKQSTVNTLLGSVLVTWSECPLMSYPLGLDFSQLVTKDQNAINEIRLAVTLMFSEKSVFVEEYIKTGAFNKVLR